MSKLEFSPSDFFSKTFLQKILNDEKCITCKEAARFAQDLFDKWLISQPAVYGRPDYRTLAQSWHSTHSNFRGMKPFEDTHTARLVCVEEIKSEECEHEIISFREDVKNFYLTSVFCLKCNKKLKVSFIKASE